MLPKKSNYEQYQDYVNDVANTFYEALKNDNLRFTKEWTAGQIVADLPHNPITKTVYKGLNSFMLDYVKDSQKYVTNSWLTFNQIKELGGYVEKGSKSVPVAFFTTTKTVEKIDEKTGEVIEEVVKLDNPIFKKANVFNIEQVRGIDKLRIQEILAKGYGIENKTFDNIEKCEQILKNLDVPIVHTLGSNEAYYMPNTDTIHLPAKEQFTSTEAYYSVAFHELGHATGHEKRLNRDLSGRFGTEEYAKEELRAEIYSYLQARELGIAYNLENHQSYVKSWVKILEDDKLEIISAIKDSLKMVRYVNENYIDKENVRAVEKEQSITKENDNISKNIDTPKDKQIPYAQIPMDKLLEKIGFNVKRDKTSARQIVMSDGVDTLIISRGSGIKNERTGEIKGEGNYVYFNSNHDANDKGTIFNFCKVRNINIHELVNNADIKDYSHSLHISSSAKYNPQVKEKYNSLKNYNDSNVKTLTTIRKIKPEILKNFSSIKVDDFQNVIFPSYTVEEMKLPTQKGEVTREILTLSGMNKKLLSKPLTHDKEGNPYDKPIKSLEEGKSGLSILKKDGADPLKITNIITGENSIDNLSYVEMKKINLDNTLLVSFNGSMKEDGIKAFEYLVKHNLPNVKNVIFAFDNDKQGKEYDDKLKTIIEEIQKNISITIDKSNSKDWNEDLKDKKKDMLSMSPKEQTNNKDYEIEKENVR